MDGLNDPDELHDECDPCDECCDLDECQCWYCINNNCPDGKRPNCRGRPIENCKSFIHCNQSVYEKSWEPRDTLSDEERYYASIGELSWYYSIRLKPGVRVRDYYTEIEGEIVEDAKNRCYGRLVLFRSESEPRLVNVDHLILFPKSDPKPVDVQYLLPLFD